MRRFARNVAVAALLLGGLVVLLLVISIACLASFALIGPLGMAATLFLAGVLVLALGATYLDDWIRALSAWADR